MVRRNWALATLTVILVLGGTTACWGEAGGGGPLFPGDEKPLFPPTGPISLSGVVLDGGAPVVGMPVELVWAPHCGLVRDYCPSYGTATATITQDDGSYRLATQTGPNNRCAEYAVALDWEGFRHRYFIPRCGSQTVDFELDSLPSVVEIHVQGSVRSGTLPGVWTRVELGYGPCSTSETSESCLNWRALDWSKPRRDGSYRISLSALEPLCDQNLLIQVESGDSYYRRDGVVCDPGEPQIMDFEVELPAGTTLVSVGGTIRVDGRPATGAFVDIIYGECSLAWPGSYCEDRRGGIASFQAGSGGIYWMVAEVAPHVCDGNVYVQVRRNVRLGSTLYYRRDGVVCNPPERQVIDFDIITPAGR